MLPRVVQPRCEVVKGFASCDVVDEQRAGSSPVVRPRNGSERLLPRRVPDLQLDLLVIDGDHACAKLHTNGEVVNLLEAFVGELQQQT